MIVTSALTKRFGQRAAVDSLNMEVYAGKIFGFLGPNGAGKTTTLRLLLDFLRQTSGTISIFGLDSRADSVAIRRRVGYLPGELNFDDRATGRQVWRYLSSLQSGSPRAFDGEVERLATMFDADLDSPIGSLSKGNRQKLGVIQAFAHSPELVVADEPTSGLDPVMQACFADLVRSHVASGNTVLVSSHQLDEVQRMADRVGIMANGRLALTKDVDVLRARAQRRVEIQFVGSAPVESFTRLPHVEVCKASGDRLTLAVEGSLTEVIRAAAPYEVVNLTSVEPDLDEVFLQFYRAASR